MKMLPDMVCWPNIILMTFIIIIVLPLVPNNKLRYYACYMCYGIVVTVISLMISPMALLRPRNIATLKVAGKAIRNFTKILGIEWELRRGDVLNKKRGAIIVANHQSSLDIMGMFNIWDVMDKCTVISKKETLYLFPFGPLAWLAGLILIDRSNPKVANNQIDSAARLLMSQYAKLWIFPEGTRNKHKRVLLPFKNGAFKVAINLQAPIIPVVFSPYYFIDSANKTFSKGKIVISVLEAVSTEGLSLDNMDLLKEKVYKLMSEEYEKLKIEVESLQHSNSNKK